MKIKSFLSLIAVVCISICFITLKSNADVRATSSDFDCIYSAKTNIDYDTNLAHYGASEVILLSEEQAETNGIPTGFSGDVLSVLPRQTATSQGVLLDFSSQQIKSKHVESITFRVYVGNDNNPNDKYPEIRIPKPNFKDHWTLQYSVNSLTNQWIDIVLDANAYSNGNTIDSISSGGYLHKFELAVRNNVEAPFYIDSIKVKLDDDAPVITYNGEQHVTISQGQELNFDVTAIDAIQGEVEIEYVWSDESLLDGHGNPLAGEHTLTFKATDDVGNTATHSITVTVTSPDTVAPTIEIPTENIYVKISTTPLISVKVTDDRDQNVDVTYSWSDGAFDLQKQLVEGVHTLTITATDASNNQTVKTITFTVTENGDDETNVIDENKLFPDQDEESESAESASSESQNQSQSSSESDSNTIAKKRNGVNPLFIIIPSGLTIIAVGVIILIIKLKRK